MFEPNPEYDQRRHDANVSIWHLLGAYLANNPGMRFGQALVNLGIVVPIVAAPRETVPGVMHDPFNEEPWVTLERVQAAYERVK